MNSRAVRAAIFFGIVSAGLLAAAVYETFQKYRAALLWKRAEATVMEDGIGFNHDGEGRLRFFRRAALQYSTPSGEQKVVADSAFNSLDFAAVRSRAKDLEPGTKIRVYYDPARHDHVQFGAEYSLEYLGWAAYYYAGAALCALAAAALLILWKPGRLCPSCKTKLEQHYRYCPFCGAAAGSPHPIPNERSVQT